MITVAVREPDDVAEPSISVTSVATAELPDTSTATIIQRYQESKNARLAEWYRALRSQS